jgi:hypothetical protein
LPTRRLENVSCMNVNVAKPIPVHAATYTFDVHVVIDKRKLQVGDATVKMLNNIPFKVSGAHRYV